MHRIPGAGALGPALAAVGFTSTIGQLVLLRELVAVYYGNELVLGLILATWLAWVAFGAWRLNRWPALPPLRFAQDGPRSQEQGKEQPGRRALAAGLVASATLLPGQVVLVRASRSLLGITPGALVPFGFMTLTIVLALAPLCLLLGWQFTLGARLLAGHTSASAESGSSEEQEARGGGSLGAAYVAESLGAVLGGALFSFLLLRWLNPIQIVMGVGAVNLAVAALLMRQAPPPSSPRTGRQQRRAVLGLGAVVLLVGAWPVGGWLHQATLRWQYTGLRFARDSIYGRIVVTGSGEQRVFYENGLLFFETQGTEAEEVVHLPLLAHPAPRRVLLIGGGVSGTLAEILRHPSIQEVQYVELDPLVVRAAQAELPPEDVVALNDPRVILAHVDGRTYVRSIREKGGRSFDVIILDLPEPGTGQLNRFYTLEFFAEVKDILAPGGLFALGLPWQEDYPGPALQRLGASIFGALDAEFPAIALVPGQRLFLLASESPLSIEPAVLSARLAERGIATRWVVPDYLRYLLTTDRVAQARQLLETAGEVRINRDLQPVSYFYDLTVWLSRFPSGLAQLLIAVSFLKLGWLAVALVLTVVLVRYAAARRRRQGSLESSVSIPMAVSLIGLAQMTMEVVVLLSFQVVHGYVYGQVGLIVTTFMGGLALGSALANRWRWPPQQTPRRSPQTTLVVILGGIVLYALTFPLLVDLAPPAWAFLLLTLLAGGLTGLAFPVAVACLPRQGVPVEGRALRVAKDTAQDPIPGLAPDMNEDRPGRQAGLLYGADLAGGCLGAVLSAVLLVPILGIPQTCLAVALVGLAGVAVLL